LLSRRGVGVPRRRKIDEAAPICYTLPCIFDMLSLFMKAEGNKDSICSYCEVSKTRTLPRRPPPTTRFVPNGRKCLVFARRGIVRVSSSAASLNAPSMIY
jgi:hypothetical protein